MKQNKYDDNTFFEKYSNMDRSVKGLQGAGEWNTLRAMLPDFNGKCVLDLGCGFGWHCQYAYENGATKIVGVDISHKMLDRAKATTDPSIEYICSSIEDLPLLYDIGTPQFDAVVSSLTFHYIPSFDDILERVCSYLVSGGDFVFSVEHPIFTAQGCQDWIYNSDGSIAHFPVDNYFIEGKRTANFLGESVTKYHKTLTTYLNSLIKFGFSITGIVEPQPSKELIDTVDGMVDELRRPMMLIISAKKL